MPMDGLAEIRKLEAYLFSRYRPTEQRSKTPSSHFFHNMDRTWNRGDINYLASTGAGHEFRDGKLPFSNQPPPQHDVPKDVRSRGCGGDWVRSETAPLNPKQVGEAGEVPLQVKKRLDSQQASTCRELLNQDSVHPILTSASSDKDAGRVTSFTIPPPEEDLSFLQSFQEKNGYVKRPMNAFLVWKKLNQGFCKRDSTQLDHKWSNLSKEEKRPYFEMAYKIKRRHHQKFPEYVFRPQRKNSKECFSSGQRTGPDISLSASRPILLVQSEFQGPGMKSTKIQSASSMKEAGNHRNSHPQRDKRDLASLHTIKQQTHCTSDNSHEVMIGSTKTSESHKQTDLVTSLQLLPNECDDYVDVVGLL